VTQRRVVLTALAALDLLLLVGLSLDAEATERACRVVNVGLALAVAAGFFIRVNDAWARYGLGGRLTRFGILLLLLVISAGSAEAYIDSVSLGYRIVGVTIALVVTGAGLLLIPDDAV
jgi:hypothetical protein